MTPIFAVETFGDVVRNVDPWILAFSAITVVVTIWMGFRSAKTSKTASDFFVAGRSVSVGWNASAISGEYLSAASFMGVAGMVMSSGYDALWYPVCYACGYLFLLLFIAGPLRRFGAYTIPDFAEGRYDSPLFRKIAVCFVLFIGFFYTMPQMKGAGVTLAYIFPGLPYWVGVVLVGAVITLNVALGGMKGITLVQAFQYWAKMFAISVPIFVLMAVYGGYGKQLGENSPKAEPATTGSLELFLPQTWKITAINGNSNELFLKLNEAKAAVSRSLGKPSLQAGNFDAFSALRLFAANHGHHRMLMAQSAPGYPQMTNPISVTSISTMEKWEQDVRVGLRSNGVDVIVASDALVVVPVAKHAEYEAEYSKRGMTVFEPEQASLRKPLPEKAPADSTWFLLTQAETTATNRIAVSTSMSLPVVNGWVTLYPPRIVSRAEERLKAFFGQGQHHSVGNAKLVSVLLEYTELSGKTVVVHTNVGLTRMLGPLELNWNDWGKTMASVEQFLATNGVALRTESANTVRAMTPEQATLWDQLTQVISYAQTRELVLNEDVLAAGMSLTSASSPRRVSSAPIGLIANLGPAQMTVGPQGDGTVGGAVSAGGVSVPIPDTIAAGIWSNRLASLGQFSFDDGLRKPLPEKAPADSTWLSPFGPLTTKAAKAAKPKIVETLDYDGELVGEASGSFTIVRGNEFIGALKGFKHLHSRFNTNAEQSIASLAGEYATAVIQNDRSLTGQQTYKVRFSPSVLQKKLNLPLPAIVEDFAFMRAFETSLATNGLTIIRSTNNFFKVCTLQEAKQVSKIVPLDPKPYSLLYTYSLIIALVCGTAGLPHILVRFYTNPDGVAAKRTTMWVMILIGIFYVFPPVFGVLGRNLMPELYNGLTGVKGTDGIVLKLPTILREKYGVLGSILSGVTCAGAFAAFMSTFSGLLVSMTGALAHDVYGRMLKPKSTSEQRLRAFKICAVLIGGIAIVLGCFVEPLEINFMVGQAFAIAAASYFPLLFMSVWWRGMTMRGAAMGMLTGGLCALFAVALTNVSNLALDKGPMGKVFAGFAPLNDFWAGHPLLRILCEQPAIWTVPLAIGLMIVVSKATRKDVPSDVRMKMLVLHAPEKLGLKQEYIQEHQVGGH